jgi:hypothetical protein
MVSPIQVMVKVNSSDPFHEAQIGCKFIAPPSRINNTLSGQPHAPAGLPTVGNSGINCSAPTIDNKAFPTRVTRALHITFVHLIINLQTVGGNLKTRSYTSCVQ